MRVFRPCFIARWFYKDALFRIKTSEKILCLTFDDGPDPDSTPQLLDILHKYNIKALFFCNGSAAERYPDLIERITSGSHIIGNHGYLHLNGWGTSLSRYITNVSSAAKLTSPGIFRPSFGHLRFCQYKKLREVYKIVFWDIMAYDFDRSFGGSNSLRVLKKKMRPGSIIVLHDTKNSTLQDFLEEFINYSISKGFRFILPQLF